MTSFKEKSFSQKVIKIYLSCHFFACDNDTHTKTHTHTFTIRRTHAHTHLTQTLCLGVNFINIIGEAFTRADPKSTKKTFNCQSLLRFWDLCAQKLLVEC